MKINLYNVPFSSYGSYLAISLAKDDSHLYIRSIFNGMGSRKLFRLDISEPYTIHALPWLLTIRTNLGDIRFYFNEEHELRFVSEGAEFAIEFLGAGLVGYAFKQSDCCWQVVYRAGSTFTQICIDRGMLAVEVPWDVEPEKFRLVCKKARFRLSPDVDGRVTGAISHDLSEAPARKLNVAARQEIEQQKERYENWLCKIPAVPDRYREAAELAWYVNWMSTVKKAGFFPSDAMLMSKNHMDRVWSWDQCFNALAVAEADSELAWNQFLFPFHFQDERGRIPDSVHNSMINRIYTKPPVHGWALKRLMEFGEVRPDQLQEIYEPLVRWTDWWTNYRDLNQNGLCEYIHGNESGWVNSTAFDHGVPLESPDLTAYLVYQMTCYRKRRP